MSELSQGKMRLRLVDCQHLRLFFIALLFMRIDCIRTSGVDILSNHYPEGSRERKEGRELHIWTSRELLEWKNARKFKGLCRSRLSRSRVPTLYFQYQCFS